MEFNWLMPIRGIQLLFALIVLGIDGNLIATYGSYTQFNYIIFVTVITLLVTAYIATVTTLVPTSTLAQPTLIFGLEVLLWVFWLAGFACIAAIDGCGGYSGGICGRVNAVLAFGVIEWILFFVTAGFTGYLAFSGGGGRVGGGAGGLNFGSGGGVVRSKTMANDTTTPVVETQYNTPGVAV